MPLAAGEKLGPYEILTPIGAGGMGEVYKARDTRLDRVVAVKVSKTAFDQRFDREARAVAALNHPNICTLHDVGPDYLVMEYVGGTELKGPLPVAKAIELACQILDALDAAHRLGITHRDLKPGNILVTKTGVKVLDFGLAKMGRAPGALLSDEKTAEATVTMEGTIAGTLYYMAPEQLQGKADVDSRADIFAFGCVLFEMLTGKRAFDGTDAASVIAAVMERPAPAVAEIAPGPLDRVLQKCLAKDPDDRWQTARDLKTELLWAAEGRAVSLVTAKARPRWWIGATAVATLAAGALAFVHFREKPPALPGARFNVVLTAPYFTLSPDGRNLAYVNSGGGATRIWIRALDSLQPRELPGTDGAYYPFWSPDGANLGFFAQGKLKKIAVAGGPAESLCDATSPRGGSWNREGVIIFGNLQGGLYRVSAEGGTPQPLTRLAASDNADSDRYPEFILGGRRFLFTSLRGTAEASGIYAGSTDSAPPVRILSDRSRAFYVPPGAGSRNGQLLFVRGNTLMALPFDPEKLRAEGAAVPMVEDLSPTPNTYFGAYSASENGILLYHSGTSTTTRNLLWIDRTGKRVAITGEPQPLFSPALSPDGKHAAYSLRASSGGTDIWLHDLERGTLNRFTFSPGFSGYPLWSPDGSYIVFGISGTNPFRLVDADFYRKPASGAANPELLLHAGLNATVEDISSDGKWLVYTKTETQTNNDLWLLPLQGEHKPQKYLDSPANEFLAQFSPDGKWMAYTSDETGQAEVYVQPIPATGEKHQISKTGGARPRWRRDGKELFYIAYDGKLMSVPVKLGGTAFDFGAPQSVMPQPLFGGAQGPGFGYQPSADGQKFLAAVPAEQTAAPVPFTIWLNWQASLKK